MPLQPSCTSSFIPPASTLPSSPPLLIQDPLLHSPRPTPAFFPLFLSYQRYHKYGYNKHIMGIVSPRVNPRHKITTKNHDKKPRPKNHDKTHDTQPPQKTSKPEVFYYTKIRDAEHGLTVLSCFRF